MKLTEIQTTQLYVLLNMFSEGKSMGFDMFAKDGFARKLASTICEAISSDNEIIIKIH